MRIKLPKDNNLSYGQDFSFWNGIPSEIEFEVEESDNYYILRGKGYGAKEYGNGALYLYKKQAFPFDIKDFDVGKKDKLPDFEAQIASRDAFIDRLVEAGSKGHVMEWGHLLEEWHESKKDRSGKEGVE